MKHLITSALPYINGIKHLGNLVGSMLPADVYARYLRQQGEEVLYICGTDEHGTPAELAAAKAGLSVEEYCAAMYQTQKDIYQQFGIQFDYFGRSSSEANKQFTQALFLELDKNGYIEERTRKMIYSLDDQRFLPDRYVEGTCPKCGYEKARGDQCDGCGSLLDPTELLNPHSVISGSTNLETRDEKHLYLRLDSLQDQVAQWIDQHQDWPQVTKGIAKKWLQEGLQPRCITRDLDWGVPVPKKGYENKVFYVWFDAPNGYVAMTQDALRLGCLRDNVTTLKEDSASSFPRRRESSIDEEVAGWWCSDDVQYSQFMAKDNVPFHAVFWPAMLLGAKSVGVSEGQNVGASKGAGLVGQVHLVDYIKAFSWLTYEGGKFSTSQGRGVFTDEALKLFPADYWRYYLMANAPEGSDSDFTFESFAQTINKDLADILGNFVNRVLALVYKYFDGKLPQSDQDATLSRQPVVTNLVDKAQELVSSYQQAIVEYRFRAAAQHLRALWVLGNEYITEQQPWKLAKTDLAQAGAVLNICVHLIRLFSVANSPMMPTIAQQLMGFLNLEQDPAQLPLQAGLDFAAIPAGHELKTATPLFIKIDADQVAELTEKYKG